MAVEIKNFKKAAKRILKAIKNKEKIILYGDADLDGISAITILKETIKSLGGNIVSVYFPDRETDGYGINKNALNILKDKAPALFIAVDLGISNFEEVKIAKKIGFEVIIIDHHEILDRLPKASIIVDPKQKGDRYPFKKFAAVGLAFKLSRLLLDKQFSKNLEDSFLELTALATISDMMPEAEENKIFINEGLKSLEKTFRPGLKVFFEMDSVTNYGAIRQVAQKIISALSAGDKIGHLNETYLLLSSSSMEEARNLARILLKKSSQKQIRIKEIIEEIERSISEKITGSIIFEGGPSWPLTLAGTIASRLCQQYEKPVFIFKNNSTESVGAVRVPRDLNSVEAMRTCKDFLITYGGHPPASGFRIKNENLERFKECLIDYFAK